MLGWNCQEMSSVLAQAHPLCTCWLATAAAPACHPPLGPFLAPWLNPTTAAFLPGSEESLTHALAEINKRAEEPGSSPEPAAESPAPAALCIVPALSQCCCTGQQRSEQNLWPVKCSNTEKLDKKCCCKQANRATHGVPEKQCSGLQLPPQKSKPLASYRGTVLGSTSFHSA